MKALKPSSIKIPFDFNPMTLMTIEMMYWQKSYWQKSSHGCLTHLVTIAIFWVQTSLVNSAVAATQCKNSKYLLIILICFILLFSAVLVMKISMQKMVCVKHTTKQIHWMWIADNTEITGGDMEITDDDMEIAGSFMEIITRISPNAVSRCWSCNIEWRYTLFIIRKWQLTVPLDGVQMPMDGKYLKLGLKNLSTENSWGGTWTYGLEASYLRVTYHSCAACRYIICCYCNHRRKHLLKKKIPAQFTPCFSRAEGDCLSCAVSTALSGSDIYQKELRIAAVCHAVLHCEHYLAMVRLQTMLCTPIVHCSLAVNDCDNKQGRRSAILGNCSIIWYTIWWASPKC